MASDLTWQIIRNNSCFLKVRKNVPKKFSTEPFNLMGVNSQRFNGLVNMKAIDVRSTTDGKGLVVSTKVNGKASKPAQSVKTVTLKTNRKALKSIEGIARNYKAIATMPALRKTSQLARSQKARKVTKKED